MKPTSAIAVFLIRFYQSAISPLLGGGKCRFYPTCSEYAAESINRYGVVYGVMLGISRICRCGPWNPGGYDRVPESEEVGIRIWIGKFFKRTPKG